MFDSMPDGTPINGLPSSRLAIMRKELDQLRDLEHARHEYILVVQGPGVGDVYFGTKESVREELRAALSKAPCLDAMLRTPEGECLIGHSPIKEALGLKGPRIGSDSARRYVPPEHFCEPPYRTF